MSWQGAFAGASSHYGSAYPQASFSQKNKQSREFFSERGVEQPQASSSAPPPSSVDSPDMSFEPSPLMDRMGPDPFERVLKHLPFRDGWCLLNVDQTHRFFFRAWEDFARFHSLLTEENINTVEGIRQHIIDSIDIFHQKVQRMLSSKNDAQRESCMMDLLSQSRATPLFWTMLIHALRQHTDPDASPSDADDDLNQEAAYKIKIFKNFSGAGRRTYLEEVVYHGGTPAEGAQSWLNESALFGVSVNGVSLGVFGDLSVEERYRYLERVVQRGTFGAEDAQTWMNLAAWERRGFFENMTRDECSTYLQKIIQRGTFGAEHAQCLLNGAAVTHSQMFSDTSSFESFTYLEDIVQRGTFGAGDAQTRLNRAAFQGQDMFEGVSASERFQYLEAISTRIDPDGTPSFGAVDALHYLQNYGERQD